MELPTLREKLTRIAVFEKLKEDEWTACLPSDPLVAGLLCRKVWPKLRPLVGVMEAPFMRADGSIWQTAGYDKTTGYEFIPPHNCKFDRVPDNPTQVDAQKAYAKVYKELYGDFFFAKEHASIPIAAVLTILARPAIRGSVPIFLFDGNVPGVGKSLVTDTIAVLATGRAMPRMNYPPNEEEQEKLLAAYALQGAALFSLDNIAAPFGGAPLDRVATAGESVQLRILGSNTVPTLAWNAVMFGTGNNIELKGDMPPRVLIARQESSLEDPRTRVGFRHDDLVTWTRVHRSWLVPALLTILRAYVMAKRPDVGTKRWGSFEAWSKLIPPAIVFAGGPDPMVARIKDITAVSDEHRQLGAIIEQWPKLVSEVSRKELVSWEQARNNAKDRVFDRPKPTPHWGLTAGEAVNALYDGSATGSQFDPIREAIEALCCPRRASGEVRPTSVALGHKLRGFRKRVVGGKRFVSETNTHTKIEVWNVESATAPSPEPVANVRQLRPSSA